MSIEEKQNFQTYLDSNSTLFPTNEKEASDLIKQFYKSNTPIEIVCSGTKRTIGKPLQVSKALSLFQSGYLYHYAFVMLGGLVIILTWFIYY